MLAKEFKEMLAQIPDDQEICCEIVCHDGEYLYAMPKRVDTEDNTIIFEQDKIFVKDIIDATLNRILI